MIKITAWLKKEEKKNTTAVFRCSTNTSFVSALHNVCIQICLFLLVFFLPLSPPHVVTPGPGLPVHYECNERAIKSHLLWLLPRSAMCTGPVRHPPLQEQHREVSTDQLQRDWLMLCQQTSEDERYWPVVSTRVWTAPTHTHSLTLSFPLSSTHTHIHTFHFNE